MLLTANIARYKCKGSAAPSSDIKGAGLRRPMRRTNGNDVIEKVIWSERLRYR
jgi:hypothetical protein